MMRESLGGLSMMVGWMNWESVRVRLMVGIHSRSELTYEAFALAHVWLTNGELIAVLLGVFEETFDFLVPAILL